MRELEETLGHDEWLEWIAFHGLYDLPDGFTVVAKLGPPLDGIGGVKATAKDFAPFFEVPHKPGACNLAGAFAFLRAHVKQ